MQSVSDFGDQAVILPLVAMVGLVMALAGWRWAALAWAVTVPGTLCVVMLAKMYVVACAGAAERAWHLQSPSGHTASAALVYGGLVAIIIPSPRPVVTAFLAALAAASLVGASRLALGVHTPADVVVGGAIGVLGACTLVNFSQRHPASASRLSVVATAALLVALLHGHRLHAEEQIGQMAFIIWPFQACLR